MLINVLNNINKIIVNESLQLFDNINFIGKSLIFFFFFFFLENRDFYINCVDKEDWFWYFQFGWLKLLTDTTDCKSNKINVTKVDIGN